MGLGIPKAQKSKPLTSNLLRRNEDGIFSDIVLEITIMNKYYGILRGCFLDFYDLRVLLGVVSSRHGGQGVPNSRTPFQTHSFTGGGGELFERKR